MRPLFLAGLQTAGIPGEPEQTVAQFEERVRALPQLFDGVQIVIAPELHLMGCGGLLDEPADWMERTAVEVPGRLTERLSPRRGSGWSRAASMSGRRKASITPRSSLLRQAS